MPRRVKRSLQKLFISIAVILIAVCATFIALYTLMPRYKTLSQETVKVPLPHVVHDAPAPVVVSTPVNLTIGKINVLATINAVGLNSAGDMDIDENPTQLAWYKLGPKPGEEGSAVIAGHYGWKDGVPSVFNDLNKLDKGDSVTTTGDDGMVKTFVVNRTALYTPHQDATDVFKSDDGKAHLNLVTCQGSWNNSARTYSERLVVFTDLVNS